MKKLILLLWVAVLVIISGCGAVKGMMIYDTDTTLKTIRMVQVLPALNSVGFEWEKVRDTRVHGFNIYRGRLYDDRYELKHIGTVGNPHATHFVDTHVKHDTEYVYTFTTFFLGKESQKSTQVKVRTLAPIEGVNFLEAYKVDNGVIKLLWRPHANPSINTYMIERSVNGGKWKFVSEIRGRLMVEYIDTFVQSKNTYSYRVVAKHYDGIYTQASPIASLSL